MKKWKKICKSIFVLPPLVTILVAVPSFLLCFVCLSEGFDGMIAYVSYTAAAYALVITITGFPVMVRSVRQWKDKTMESHPLVKKIMCHPAGRRYLTDGLFRAEVSLYPGLFINFLYIVMKLSVGIYSRSLWLIALGAYYIILALMRFFLLHHAGRFSLGKEIKSEFRRYRLCGIILLFMNQALTAVVTLVVHQNKGFEYPGLLIYGMAAYSFYITITAVVNVVKFRRYGSPVISAAKAINLVAALVSMLSLTTAMIAEFGGGEDFRRTMTAAVGGSVCTIVILMAVFMIVRATVSLKKLERSYVQDGKAENTESDF